MNENDRARQIQIEQAIRRRNYRCGMCGLPAVPSDEPYAPPMCKRHGSKHMVHWKPAYVVAADYLNTWARDPEITMPLHEWVASVDLTLWKGPTREEIMRVLELWAFWGVSQTDEPTPITNISMFGPKRRPPVEHAWGSENATAVCSSAAGQGDGRAERATDRDSRQSGATPDAGHRHNLHNRGCTPARRAAGCDCAFPYCLLCPIGVEA